MARGAPQRDIWLGLALALGGLLAMGTAVLGPTAALSRQESRRGALAPTASPTHPLTPTRETASPGATPTHSLAAPAEGTTTLAATLVPTPSPQATPGPPLLPTPDGQARVARVPILMYHYVGENPPDADAIRLDLTVPPDRFEAQLAYLRQAGYSSITLEDLVLYLTTGRPLPEKPVIFTFDDGYLDNFLYAFPLLRQYGFGGTFFVVTQFLDEGRAGYMSWQQARLMQANGMEIESHGVSHEDLAGAPAEFVAEQLKASRARIEKELGKPVRFFAYPFGRYDQRTIEELEVAGYWAAVTTEGGAVHSGDDLFRLTRVRVHGSHDLDRFVATLDYYLR